MDGPDASRRHHVSDAPSLITLTEDERLHGLDLFADEPQRTKQSQAEQPQSEESQIYERVPAYTDSIAPPVRRLERATQPVPPETWSVQIWRAQLLAAALTAAVLVFAPMTVRVMRSTAGVQIATVNDRTTERTPAVHSPPPPIKVTEPEPVVSRESAALRAPARSTPPISPQREAPRVRPDPPIKTASVSRPRTVKPPPIPATAIAPLLSSPAPPVNLPAEPRPVVAPATPPRAEASAAPAPRMPAPETAIQTVLGQYRTAYRELDAGAARAVWPSVDTKALRKAFDSLERQDLIFDSCQIAVREVRAVASCNGYAWYVPRVGNKGPHDDQRQWEFKLSKVDDVWLIDSVSAR